MLSGAASKKEKDSSSIQEDSPQASWFLTLDRWLIDT